MLIFELRKISPGDVVVRGGFLELEFKVKLCRM